MSHTFTNMTHSGFPINSALLAMKIILTNCQEIQSLVMRLVKSMFWQNVTIYYIVIILLKL